MRGVAHTLHLMGGGDDVSMMFPYFQDSGELYEKHIELEAKAANPDLQAKLKEARRKHFEVKKNNGA